MPPFARRRRGISLIEALVALTVAGIGMVSVLGLQAQMRFNADTAKQRAEAVRIAQEAIEVRRSYEDIEQYDEARGAAPDSQTATGYDASNTQYTVTVTSGYADDGNLLHGPRRKIVDVEVSWSDRTGQTQAVRLASTIHGTPPELAGSLLIPSASSGLRNPGRRNPGIPPEATIAPDGRTSVFAPPGMPGVTWVFDNISGVITQICIADACTPPATSGARLLAGYVRFATDVVGQPTGANAEVPPGSVVPVEVEVVQSDPVSQVVPCAERVATGYVAYYCAVPAGVLGRWSGRSRVLIPNASDGVVALDIAEVASTHRRICRYTTQLAHLTVPTEMTNEGHPLDYVDVREALVNQNFLVIRAGNDANPAFDCPNDDDGTGSPYIFGRTYRHQPAN